MRNIPRLVPQLQRLKNCATRSRPFTYLDGFLLGASTHSWRNQGRMFRPHNRIFLHGQALRTEKRKKKKETEKRKRKNAPGTLWMLAISRKETKIKQALPDFTVFSRPREIPRATSPFSNSSLCVFPSLLSIPSSFAFVLSLSTSFNEIMGQRQFLNRVTRSLIV